MVATRLALRWPTRTRVGAWVLALACVADGVRSTADAWPRPLSAVSALQAAQLMAADSAPGATLELPLEAPPVRQQACMLEAAIHGRATTCQLTCVPAGSAPLPHNRPAAHLSEDRAPHPPDRACTNLARAL